MESKMTNSYWILDNIRFVPTTTNDINTLKIMSATFADQRKKTCFILKCHPTDILHQWNNISKIEGRFNLIETKNDSTTPVIALFQKRKFHWTGSKLFCMAMEICGECFCNGLAMPCEFGCEIHSTRPKITEAIHWKYGIYTRGFKKIPNFNYEIDEYCRIKCLSNGNIRLPAVGPQFGIKEPGKKTKNISVYRTCLNCFFPEPNFENQTDHVDGDSSNNHLHNLQYLSIEEHKVKSRTETGKIASVKNSKRVTSCDVNGVDIETFSSAEAAATFLTKQIGNGSKIAKIIARGSYSFGSHWYYTDSPNKDFITLQKIEREKNKARKQKRGSKRAHIDLNDDRILKQPKLNFNAARQTIDLLSNVNILPERNINFEKQNQNVLLSQSLAHVSKDKFVINQHDKRSGKLLETFSTTGDVVSKFCGNKTAANITYLNRALKFRGGSAFGSNFVRVPVNGKVNDEDVNLKKDDDVSTLTQFEHVANEDHEDDVKSEEILNDF